MCKKVLSVLLLLCALCAPFGVSAENGADFSLSDAETKKNRIFETTLSAKGAPVAALTATLTYDSSAFAFREAKAKDKNALMSVNSRSEGVVSIAYASDSAIEGDLVVFKFKSLDSGGSISLNITQALTSDSATITPLGITGADITHSNTVKNTRPPADTTAQKEENSKPNTAKESEAVSDTRNKTTALQMDVGRKDHNTTLIICVAGGSAALILVAGLAFYLGRKSSKK